MQSSKAIAETILSQLGGHRFKIMTGASQLLALSEGGLQFSLPRGAKDGVNKVQILLDPSDTYTIKALKCNYKQHTFEEKHVSEGVYGDMLEDAFTRATGLYTRL